MNGVVLILQTPLQKRTHAGWPATSPQTKKIRASLFMGNEAYATGRKTNRRSRGTYHLLVLHVDPGWRPNFHTYVAQKWKCSNSIEKVSQWSFGICVLRYKVATNQLSRYIGVSWRHLKTFVNVRMKTSVTPKKSKVKQNATIVPRVYSGQRQYTKDWFWAKPDLNHQ